MSDDPRVQQLLDSDATPEAVGGSCAELFPVVRDRWRQVVLARANHGAQFQPAAGSDATLPASPSEGISLPVVPGYEVAAVLGVGGMGVVFRARHLGLNRVVALKMVLAGAYAGSRERARFQREAEAVAALRHPNVVQVYDVGESEGRLYFTMEYAEDGTLADKLAGTHLPTREAVALLATLAGAVEAAHAAGVVHRDLKPANVLLTADGVPKVTDFGLARRLSDGAGLTRTGTAVGTPSYMAPEQARGHPDAAGPAADVYALGAILYELLTGRPPFRAETAAETVHQLLSQDPVPPSRLSRTLPRDLETVCLKCLHKEPSRRYSTAAELADDLGRFLCGEAVAARPEGWLARLARRVRRRPVLSAALLVATLSTAALVGGGAWTISERKAAARAAEAKKAADDTEQAATERAADDDLNEMAGFLGQSSWSGARAALERVKGRLGDRGSDELRGRLSQGGRDLHLGERLEAIRLDSARNLVGFLLGRCDKQYEEAFRDAGFGRTDDDPHVVAGQVRASNISSALLAALDHWSATAADSRRGWILEVARRADRDPTGWRDRARDPGVRADAAAFARLIETAPVAGQPVSLLLALDKHSSRRSRERLPFLERVQRSNPDDFWANVTLGNVLTLTEKPGEAVRYFQAAVSLRPRLALGYHHLGFALFAAGRMEDAVEPFRRAVDLDPDSPPTVHLLAFLLSRLGRHDEAIDQFTAAIRLRPAQVNLHTLLGQSLEATGRHDEALARHRQAVALDTKDETASGTARKELRNFLIRHGRGEEARATWRAAITAKPLDHGVSYGYAEYCLFLGDEEEFRRARRGLLAAFGVTADPHVAERVGRACLLLPVGGDDLAQAVALVDRAAAADRSAFQVAQPYFAFARGLAEYRLGRFERAISVLEGDASRVLGPSPRLVLAMALHKGGRTAAARKVLAAAVAVHDWRVGNVRDQDGWICHVLRREAEGLILPNLSAFLAGKHQPQDNDERLALLGECQFTNRALASARLYADAFAADPPLAEDFRTGHRSHAARAAALAGCGRGEDARPLGDPERMRWRAQAREWLRADLAAWVKALDGDSAATRDVVRLRLSQWRADPDFAGLCDPVELGKLPAKERTDWLAFWDEVGDVFRRVACGK